MTRHIEGVSVRVCARLCEKPISEAGKEPFIGNIGAYSVGLGHVPERDK